MTNPQYKIYNGLTDQPEWECGGFSFRQVPNYDLQIEKMPRNRTVLRDLFTKQIIKTTRPRKGNHALTYTASLISSKRAQKSQFYDSGESIHDICIIWSLLNGHHVLVDNQKNHIISVPSETSIRLAEPFETVETIQKSFSKIRRRPLSQRYKSAILIYLEMQTIRTLQVRVALLTAIFECISQIPPPSVAMGRVRYAPVINHFLELRQFYEIHITEEQMSDLIISIYRMRNEFLHSGISPYRWGIKVGDTVTSMGRLVIAARMLCALSLGNLLGVPSTTVGTAKICESLRLFQQSGHLIPLESGFGVGTAKQQCS